MAGTHSNGRTLVFLIPETPEQTRVQGVTLVCGLVDNKCLYIERSLLQEFGLNLMDNWFKKLPQCYGAWLCYLNKSLNLYVWKQLSNTKLSSVNKNDVVYRWSRYIPPMVTSGICDYKLNARMCIRGDCHHWICFLCLLECHFCSLVYSNWGLCKILL